MSSYESRIPHFVEGKTEEEVRKQLVSLGIQLQQKIEISSIYYNSGKGRIIAWYFHDIKSNVPLPKNEVVKKKTKKKITKKGQMSDTFDKSSTLKIDGEVLNRSSFKKTTGEKLARRVGNESDDPLHTTVTNISEIVNGGETLAAGEVISAVKAVYSNGTNIFLGDADTDYQHASIVGITLTAGNIGEEVRYILNGPLYDSAFVFTDGAPVFLGLNGQLTQTDPGVSGYNYRVLLGYATGTNGININIQEPIEL